MKYYLIDEIDDKDMERISLFLMEKGVISGLEKIFWITVPEEYLNNSQAGHAGCKPYVFAVELGARQIRAEFFIRTLQDMRCSCNGYPEPEQGQFIVRFMDEMIEGLGIRT